MSGLQMSQTGPRLRDLRLFGDSPPRNAVTWADDDVFIFDYVSSVAADGAESTSSESSRSSPSNEEPIVYENPLTEEEYSCITEEMEAVAIEPRPINFTDSSLLSDDCHTEDATQTSVCISNVGYNIVQYCNGRALMIS